MSLKTENSSKKSLEVAEKKPVSVYSVNFARVINNLTDKKTALKRKNASLKKADGNSFSKKVFQWRNAVAVAAILAIGVLHFAFQISFINREVGKNRPLIEVPPVKIEPAPVELIKPESEDADFEAKKVNAPLAPKAAKTVKQRAVEFAPVKPQPKKKDAVESRDERLRRAEKILTGV